MRIRIQLVRSLKVGQCCLQEPLPHSLFQYNGQRALRWSTFLYPVLTSCRAKTNIIKCSTCWTTIFLNPIQSCAVQLSGVTCVNIRGWFINAWDYCYIWDSFVSTLCRTNINHRKQWAVCSLFSQRKQHGIFQFNISLKYFLYGSTRPRVYSHATVVVVWGCTLVQWCFELNAN